MPSAGWPCGGRLQRQAAEQVARRGSVVSVSERPSRPAIVTVDDDPGVSRAVARDLRRAVRRGPPDRARRERRADPRGAARAEAARRAGGGDPGRLPDAADERHRVPRAGHGHLPVRPARAAHGVRRHRRGHRRDQPRRRRPLPAQAVGPAGGEALPGRRRAARGLARPRPPAGAGDQGGRAPLVGAVVRGARLPGPQPGAVPLVHLRRAGGRAAAGRGRGRGRDCDPGGDHRRTARCCAAPTDAELAARVGLSRRPGRPTSTTWS